MYPEHLTEELDYELELAVVLRKAGKWFAPEDAADYIGGYVIFNDITARDIQRGEMRSGVFSFCKAIDTFCPLGPWIVTPDELGDPHDLRMELRVNGEVRQESHSGRMSVTIPEILSRFSALGYSAGDVLSTGTVAGVAGFKSKEERMRLYLKPGDVVEAEIERIGVLRNPVVSWQDAHDAPPPPRVAPVGRGHLAMARSGRGSTTLAHAPTHGWGSQPASLAVDATGKERTRSCPNGEKSGDLLPRARFRDAIDATGRRR